MGILSKIFTWWDGATIGTSLYSWRKGKAVGTDSLGNRYYQSSDGKRRWVIYNGPNDASRASDVFNHDGLPHVRRHFLRKQPSGYIDSTAYCQRQDHANRFVGVTRWRLRLSLRLRSKGDTQRSDEAY